MRFRHKKTGIMIDEDMVRDCIENNFNIYVQDDICIPISGILEKIKTFEYRGIDIFISGDFEIVNEDDFTRDELYEIEMSLRRFGYDTKLLCKIKNKIKKIEELKYNIK